MVVEALRAGKYVLTWLKTGGVGDDEKQARRLDGL
jgi:hypothetical protein